MSNATWWVVAALACWRITSILYRETIFQSLRQRIGIDSDHIVDERYADRFITQLFECYWCLSVWVGVLCLLALFVWPYILLPFAFSAVAIIIDGKLNG